MLKIGFTTSFPVEVLYAAGVKPIDLNNIFITGNAQQYVDEAEFKGYPRNICAWIKGLYSVALEESFDAIIGVVEGDCSNTHSLMATLQDAGKKVVSFSFPFDKNPKKLMQEIEKLEHYFNVDHKSVLQIKVKLDKIREKLVYLDFLTYSEGKITGAENHFWLVNSSDFMGNPIPFEQELDSFLHEAKIREPFKKEIRLAYLGVPPIITDIYDFLWEQDANVVFNEIQRQFAMPYLKKNLIDQYLAYTYPYSIFDRLKDIQSELKKRKVDGVISYAQSFCHRQIDAIILKKYIDLPMLNLEGDRPGKLDARSKIRIESFLDMIRL